MIKRNCITSIFSILLIITLISPLVLQPYQANAMTSPLWDKKFDKDIDWMVQTDFDVLIVGSNKKLYAISERRGEQIWSIETGSDVNKNDVVLVDGSDILLVNREIEKDKAYKVEAYEVTNGNKLWENNKIKGHGIAVLPILDRWTFLYIIDADSSDKVRPHIYNMNVFNGKIIWESEFNSSFEGTKSSGVWIFGDSYDVSGFYPPIYIDDEIYFIYDGLRKFSFKNGKQQWYTSYTVNEEDDLVRTDADIVVTDKTIYTVGAGIIRAIDRKNGSVLWASEKFGLVPLFYYDQGKIYGQIGGTFLKPNLNDVKNVDPVGVFSLDAKTGKTLWKFGNCQSPITNIMPLKDKIYVSDKVSLIAIDKKTGKDIYKETLDFYSPVLTASYEKGKSIIVQSGQKVASYDAASGHKKWIAGFKDQTPGFLDKLSNRLLIGAAIIIFTGGLATPILLGSYMAYDINRAMNRNAAEDRLYRQMQSEKAFWGGAKSFRNTPGFLQAVQIRKERLEMLNKQKKVYFYVYGEDQQNGDIKGVGGVNIDSGSMDFKIDLDNDKPAYFYDRIYGLLFYSDGNKLSSYKVY